MAKQTWPATIKAKNLLKFPGEFGARLAAQKSLDDLAFLDPDKKEGHTQQLVDTYNKVNDTNLDLEGILQREEELIKSQPPAR